MKKKKTIDCGLVNFLRSASYVDGALIFGFLNTNISEYIACRTIVVNEHF